MKHLFFYGVLLTVWLFSCQKNRNANRTMDADSLRNVYTALRDSLDTSWEAMSQTDEAKHGNLKRLLQEVAYAKVYNRPLLDSLQRMHAALPGKRYTPQTMVSDRIDAYDLATDSLVSALPQLLASVPDIESYPLCAELSQEIQAANEGVLVERIHYDKHARAYNEFVKQYAEELKEAGYTDLEPKLLFQLASQ